MTSQRAYRFFPALVAVLTFIVFLPALQNDWVNWDDTTNFLDNADYRGLGWIQLKWMWTTLLLSHYIPLTWMTLGLDYKIWGMDPFGYHLTNVLLHTANAVLFYFLAAAVFKLTVVGEARSTIRLAALFAALLFALHPLRVESVAWITERRDVLSGFFYLLAILAYIHAHDPGRPERHRYYWICFGFFALALLSKEIAVTLPAVLLILDVYPLRRLPSVSGRWIAPRVWLEKIPFFALSIALFVVMSYVAKTKDLFDARAGLGWFPRIAVPLYDLAFYLWKTVAPTHLSVFYPFTPHKIDPAAAPLAISAIVVLSVTALAIFLRRSFPALLTVCAAYFVTLSPVLGFVTTGPRLANDRNTYLACLGWALLAGAALVFGWGRSRAMRWLLAAAASLAILSLAELTERQIPIWHDSDALWTQALRVEPSFIAYTNMAEVLASRGDDLWAMEHFRNAIQMRPDFSPARLGLGGCLLRLHRPADAAREYQAALDLGQNRAFAHNGLACALALEGRLDEAIQHFQQAIQLRPGYADARRNLAQVLATRNSRPTKP